MDIVAALRTRAEMSAKATQLVAQSKSERNRAAGDESADYDAGTKEQTVEWRAADEITRLRELIAQERIECAALARHMSDFNPEEIADAILRRPIVTY